MYQPGTRVRVKSGDGQVDRGMGTYLGTTTVYVIKKDGHILSARNAEEKPIPGPGEKVIEIADNPKIQLDSGEIVYGCQVWWEPTLSKRQEIALTLKELAPLFLLFADETVFIQSEQALLRSVATELNDLAARVEAREEPCTSSANSTAMNLLSK